MLKSRVPVLIKVLLYHFGLWPTLAAGVRFAASLILASAVFFVVASRSPFWAAAATIVLLVLFWRLKQLDVLGKAFVVLGILRENTSKLQPARLCFLSALKFLKVRDKAYEGLARITRTKAEACQVGRLIQLREKRLSAVQAFVVARSNRQCGELREARAYYELADKVQPSDSIKLELARVHLVLSEPDLCLRVIRDLRKPDQKGECYFLTAAALRAKARPEEALRAVNRAIQLRPFNPCYHLEKGKILETQDRCHAAVREYSNSIRIHPRNPEALFRRGVLSLANGETDLGIKDLERCYFYQNTNAQAYLIVDATKGDPEWRPAATRTEMSSWLTVELAASVLRKGETLPVRIFIKPDVAVGRCRVVALEPFGGGLEIRPRQVGLGPLEPGTCYEVTVEVTAKRSSEVNLNRPWILNLMFITEQFWGNRLIEFEIRDETEGRIFLVLSEDHEPRLPRERLNGDGNVTLQASDVELDLVAKSQLANQLAEKYGFKWTHLLDAGTAVGLLRWAGRQSEVWRALSERTERYYKAAYASGHDCQIHLHLSGVPESYFFCYDYDRDHDLIAFNVDRKRSFFPEWQINSWANVTKPYGGSKNIDGRRGSLAHARQTVASLFFEQFPSYQPIFFRAGQWDLGATTAEREKSILALRENGVLADSSVTQGYSYYEKGFSFGKPVHRAAYFTSRNNPEEEAESLVDAGILEVVPILLQSGRGALTPRDKADPVVSAWEACHEDRRKKSGVHIIMEIEHLATAEAAPMTSRQVARLDGAWSAMERHFLTIRRRCKDVESVGASEAIYAWLDYYSPELILRLKSPEVGKRSSGRESTSLLFPLAFLGEGILCEEEKRYELAVPLPVTGRRAIAAVRILGSDGPVFETRECHGCSVGMELLLSKHNRHSFTLEVLLA